jgi:transcriptional regulator with XRE-family HTH domain
MTTTKSPAFHELLKKYRYDSGFTQVDLANALDNHQPVISNYERGRLTPSRDEILAITKILKLDERQTNDLLVSAGYTPIERELISPDAKISTFNYFSAFDQASNPSYRELNIQIQDIKDSIASLGEHLEKNDKSNSPKNRSQPEQLLAQVQDLQTAITELQATSKEITAPVALPSKQQLEVRLIPTTSFERLEEYRAEENRWFTWAGIFLGAVIGLFINLVTGGQATVTTWIVAATFFIMVIFTSLSARSYSQRAKNLRDEIVEKKAPINQSSNVNNAG